MMKAGDYWRAPGRASPRTTRMSLSRMTSRQEGWYTERHGHGPVTLSTVFNWKSYSPTAPANAIRPAISPRSAPASNIDDLPQKWRRFGTESRRGLNPQMTGRVAVAMKLPRQRPPGGYRAQTHTSEDTHRHRFSFKVTCVSRQSPRRAGVQLIRCRCTFLRPAAAWSPRPGR